MESYSTKLRPSGGVHVSTQAFPKVFFTLTFRKRKKATRLGSKMRCYTTSRRPWKPTIYPDLPNLSLTFTLRNLPEAMQLPKKIRPQTPAKQSKIPPTKFRIDEDDRARVPWTPTTYCPFLR